MYIFNIFNIKTIIILKLKKDKPSRNKFYKKFITIV